MERYNLKKIVLVVMLLAMIVLIEEVEAQDPVCRHACMIRCLSPACADLCLRKCGYRFHGSNFPFGSDLNSVKGRAIKNE